MYHHVQVRVRDVKDGVLGKCKPSVLWCAQTGVFEDLALELQSPQLLKGMCRWVNLGSGEIRGAQERAARRRES